MNNVIWTDYAEDSFKVIVDFLDEHWGTEVTESLIILMDKRIKQLQINPSIAPNVNDSKFKKLIIHKFISFFYTVNSNTIKIVLIWDNRQDPNKLEQFLTINKE